ncbi:hypothetical protein CONCODRAFT_68659 [Conidiobolus coronatus NRRL 28638]|uniref:ARM repeat-containing protein n=1 Tax=Conidiobolus coronatus (strain ATCC 28846 / CBS 209.66 / NRRL 28638) TaxID=796925 RepID=A0A137PD92_CONC2|nr:hypothetical protein CONCODRAFT_68659 [Conidiobolus coronatus NRRL 28638]|eukprot:KXN72911.1 hypothetical protein CONCODRAFT_68659 [Conidiobolus coronatus NRRL 28638]
MNRQLIEETLENRNNAAILTQQLATIFTKYNIVKLQELSPTQLNSFLLDLTSLITTFSKSLAYLPVSRIELIIRIINNLIKFKFEADQGTITKLLKVLNLCYLNYSPELLPISLNLEQVQILITLWFDRPATVKGFKWKEDTLNGIIGTLVLIVKADDSNFKENLISYLKLNIMGTILYHCLTISLEESYLQLRVNSLSLILTLIALNKDKAILYSIFPGVIGNLGKLVTRDLVKENKQIIILGLKILITFIPKALICSKVEELKLLESVSGKKMSWVNVEEPMEGYNYKSHELIDSLFQHLTLLRAHQNEEIQRLLVELSLIVLERCQHPTITPEGINIPLENLIFYLGKSISNMDNGTSNDVLWLSNWYKSQTKDLIQQLLLQAEPILKLKLEQFQIKLRTRTDIEKRQVIYGLLGCLILFGDQIQSRVDFNELLLTLCRWLKLSSDKIEEVQETSSDIIININFTVDNELNRTLLPHLVYINSLETLELLSKLIGFIGYVSDITDLVRPCLDIYSSSNLPSFKIPSLFILLNLIKGNRDNIELPFNLNRKSDSGHIDLLELAILDQINSIESPDNYLAPYIQLHIYWNSINSQAINFREHLTTHLYPILSKLTQNNTQLTTFALRCLNLIKEKCEYSDLKEICLDNLDFLMNSVSDNLYEIEYKGIEACQVLRGLLRLIPDKSLNLLDSILDQLLEGLNVNMFNDAVAQELLQVIQVVANEAINLGVQDAKLDSLEFVKKDQIINGYTSVDFEYKLNCSEPMKLVLKELDEIYYVQKVNQPIIEEIEEEESNEDQPVQLPEDDVAKPNKYQEFCLRILKPIQYFISSDNPQLRLQSLNILGVIFKFGSSNSNNNIFLNELHYFWPSLMQRLKDKELTTVLEAMRVTAEVIESNHDFLMSRVNDELVNSLLIQLNQIKLSISSQEGEYSNNYILLAASLGLIEAVLRTGCLPNYRIRDLFLPVIDIGTKLLTANENTINELMLSSHSSPAIGSLTHLLSSIQSNLTQIKSNVYIYQYLQFKYPVKLGELESLINQRGIEFDKINLIES